MEDTLSVSSFGKNRSTTSRKFSDEALELKRNSTSSSIGIPCADKTDTDLEEEMCDEFDDEGPASTEASGENIQPSKLNFTHKLGDSVIINVARGDWQPDTVPDMFLETVKRLETKPALAYRDENGWSWMNYKNYYKSVLDIAKVFIQLGLKPGEGVAIACSNTQNYFIAALGTIFAGGIFVGIPCLDNACLKSISLNILRECNVNIIVVDKFIYINVIHEIAPSATSLTAILDLSSVKKSTITKYSVNFQKLKIRLKEGHIPGHKVPAFDGNDMYFLSQSVTDSVLLERLTQIASNKCCAVFYPNIKSHFTPSGVMYSHDNLTYMAKRLGENLDHEYGFLKSVPTEFRILSHLPLNNPFSLVLEMLVPWTQGGLTAFPDPKVKGYLIPTLVEVQPTLFCATSKMWLQLQRWLTPKANSLGALKKFLLVWARKRNLLGFYKNFSKDSSNLKFRQPGCFGRNLVKKVKRSLGLHNCKIFLSSAGDLNIETLEYFISYDIPIIEAFSSPLLSGPHSMGSYSSYLIGSVGQEITHLKSKLSDVRKSRGKIYCKGRHVCMGIIYPVSLSILLDKDGYIYTGLACFREDDRFLKVYHENQGKLIMSNGMKVSYGKIEKLVRDSLPIIDYCVVVGHHKSYLSMLITLKTEIDPKTLRPTSILVKSVQRWLNQRGVPFTSIEELVNNKCFIVTKTIEDAILNVNKSMTSSCTKIRQWRILPKDFSLVDGDIDPITMELRHEVILRKYKDVIDDIYHHDQYSY